MFSNHVVSLWEVWREWKHDVLGGPQECHSSSLLWHRIGLPSHSNISWATLDVQYHLTKCLFREWCIIPHQVIRSKTISPRTGASSARPYPCFEADGRHHHHCLPSYETSVLYIVIITVLALSPSLTALSFCQINSKDTSGPGYGMDATNILLSFKHLIWETTLTYRLTFSRSKSKADIFPKFRTLDHSSHIRESAFVRVSTERWKHASHIREDGLMLKELQRRKVHGILTISNR